VPEVVGIDRFIGFCALGALSKDIPESITADRTFLGVVPVVVSEHRTERSVRPEIRMSVINSRSEISPVSKDRMSLVGNVFISHSIRVGPEIGLVSVGVVDIFNVELCCQANSSYGAREKFDEGGISLVVDSLIEVLHFLGREHLVLVDPSDILGLEFDASVEAEVPKVRLVVQPPERESENSLVSSNSRLVEGETVSALAFRRCECGEEQAVVDTTHLDERHFCSERSISKGGEIAVNRVGLSILVPHAVDSHERADGFTVLIPDIGILQLLHWRSTF
jgi:hypothetical protein